MGRIDFGDHGIILTIMLQYDARIRRRSQYGVTHKLQNDVILRV